MQLSPEISHVLAVLADAYTPLLLLIALVCVISSWIKNNKWHFVQFIYAVFAVYGFMFADKYFQLWAAWGLDYSTHSAAAFALVVVISVNKPFKFVMLFAISLVIYGCLMNILNYHSWADMLSTLAAMLLLLFPMFRRAKPAKAGLPAI